MTEEIQIEQHSFANDNGDEEDLYELTHLTRDDLDELNIHITLSAVSATDRILRLQRKLKNLRYMLDRSLAS